MIPTLPRHGALSTQIGYVPIILNRTSFLQDKEAFRIVLLPS